MSDIVKAAGDVQTEASMVLAGIMRAVADPAVDVEKFERLLAIQERLLTDQRRTSYMAAMARLQERMPQITKAGTIVNKSGNVTAKFAKIEDVDTVIRPLLAAEGFSSSFNSTDAGAGGTEYSCTLSHRDGHAETKTLMLPPDKFEYRSAAQNAGSNISYARRYLLSMHLNLVTRDVDNDGAGEPEALSAEQVAQIRAELAEVRGSEAKLLAWQRVSSFEEIRGDQFKPILMFIAEKRKGGR